MRDHHDSHGAEAQILYNEELVIGRTFHQRADPTRTPREMAISWAVEERTPSGSPAWRGARDVLKEMGHRPRIQPVGRARSSADSSGA
jgi:hypothetical protein